MEMMNRAIEDASDFMEMKRKLLEGREQQFAQLQREAQREMLDMQKLTITPAKPIPPKRPGENRRDYRARVLSAQKAAT